MDRHIVGEFVPIAYDILKDSPVYKDGQISSSFKRIITSFGTAVQMGKLTPAVAFFSQRGQDDNFGQELLKIILQMLKTHGDASESEPNLFHYICEEDKKRKKGAKLEVLNASVAVKFAMNLFESEERKKRGE